MKFAHCTLWQPNYQPLADLVLPNRREYCQRHNHLECFKMFDYKDGSLRDVQRKLGFAKLRMILETFQDQPSLTGIWFADLDGMITNMKNNLDGKFAHYTGQDIIFTVDARGMTPGSMLVRNTDHSKRVLMDALEMENDPKVPYEGEALGLTLGFWTFKEPGTHMEVDCWTDGVKLSPQRFMNSYQYDLYTDIKPIDILNEAGQWHPGDFFIHWPGRNLEQRIQHFKDYEKKVVR